MSDQSTDKAALEARCEALSGYRRVTVELWNTSMADAHDVENSYDIFIPNSLTLKELDAHAAQIGEFCAGTFKERTEPQQPATPTQPACDDLADRLEGYRRVQVSLDSTTQLASLGYPPCFDIFVPTFASPEMLDYVARAVGDYGEGRFREYPEPQQPATPEPKFFAENSLSTEYQFSGTLGRLSVKGTPKITYAQAKAVVLEVAALIQKEPAAIAEPRPHQGSGAPERTAAELLGVPKHLTCACGNMLFYSARQRGDGLCGPCHRKATGTQAEHEKAHQGSGAPVEPTAVDRYFDEQMKDPEFAAEYHKERAYISLDDWFRHRKAFNDSLKKVADSLGMTIQEAYDRMLRGGTQ